jgi:hypothetical protein
VNFWQLDPSNSNATLELGRLARGGRATLTSAPQLTAGGYFDLTNQTTPTNNSLCGVVLVEVSNAVTIPVTPYCILIALSFVIAGSSYVSSLPCLRHDERMKRHVDSWALHYAGQLHREVIERLSGRLEGVDTATRWPTLGPEFTGPDVVNENGSQRFAKGNCYHYFLGFFLL